MIHPNLNVLIGPPGTGKTTSLLSIMQRELEAGVAPNRIGFLAFTKAASEEATKRACERFGYQEFQLPYFRTIHSLAFRQLGMRRESVLQWKHYKTIANNLGIEFKGNRAIDDEFYGMAAGDRLMFLEGLARVQQRPLQTVWEEADEHDIDLGELARYSKALAAYKTSNGLQDFTDMLESFVKAPAAVPGLDVLIVDEAQDLSGIQWRVVQAIAAKTERVYIAGDDRQAIFQWAGADVGTFLALQGKTTVLEQSYRIPGLVHKRAESISERIVAKSQQTYRPRSEMGIEQWYQGPEEVDLSTGTWLLLARNGYMLHGLEDTCRRQGFSYTSVGKNNPLESPALKAITTYTRLVRGVAAAKAEVTEVLKWMSSRRCPEAVRQGLSKCRADKMITLETLQGWGFMKEPPIWHVALDLISDSDREFFIAARRRGETLTQKPRIKISTIHSAKGQEADNVMLLTGMSQRTFQQMEKNPDAEHRVFYVGVTRARQGLHVVTPNSGEGYDL